MPTKIKIILSQIQHEWGSGLTVALISFPLSLAIALAAGASPMTGLIAAFWGGLLGSLFVGSGRLVVGVGASVITMQSGFIASYGNDIGYLSLLTIASGLFLLLIRIFNIQTYIRYVPSSIVTGFAAGIGLVITISQASQIFGFSLDQKFDIQNFNPLTFSVFLIASAIMLGFEKISKKIPSAILISVIGILLGYFLNQGDINLFGLEKLDLLISQGYDLQTNIFQFPNYFELNYSLDLFRDLAINGSLIAIVVVIESLITSRFVKHETGTASTPKSDITGLGFINIILGVLGGMAVLSLISRTSAGIQTGGKTRVATILYAFFMLVLLLLLLPVIKFYPLVIIATILIRVALPLINYNEFTKLYKTNKFSFSIALIVAGLVVFSNASVAVLIGAGLALLEIIRNLSKSEFSLFLFQRNKQVLSYTGFKMPKDLPVSNKAIYSVDGMIAYFNSDIHTQRLLNLKQKNIIIDTSHLFDIDYDGANEIAKTITQMIERGQNIEFIKAHPRVQTTLLATMPKTVNIS